jgi:hypothetical protein
VVRQEISVKKYLVKLSDGERERLNTLIDSGKRSAQKLMKACILLKGTSNNRAFGRE